MARPPGGNLGHSYWKRLDGPELDGPEIFEKIAKKYQ